MDILSFYAIVTEIHKHCVQINVFDDYVTLGQTERSTLSDKIYEINYIQETPGRTL